MTSYECAICLENIKQNNMYITDCCHKFCNECFADWSKSSKEQKIDVKCPTCRTVLEEVILPIEQSLVLVIQNVINYDINYMYDEQDEDQDSDENAQSDFEVEDNDEIERMIFYNVRVIKQDDDEDDEDYHINRTRQLEEELYGESFTY